MKVGVHVSIAGTIDQSVDRAVQQHCDTFQIFTRNPRGWRVAPLEEEEIERFKKKLAEHAIGPVISHMPYLPNLSCPKDDLYEKSVDALLGEVDRCTALGISYIVIHLGSHLGLGREVGLKRLVAALNLASKKIKGETPHILLENTAGQTNSMGSRFQDLREILDKTTYPERLGVCLDTCLPPGSLVFSGDIPRPVEEMGLVDTVLGSAGTANRVLRLWKRPYSGQIVSIKPEGLPWISATSEHPILCVKPKGWRHLEETPWRVRKVGRPAWVFARDVRPEYFVVMPKLAIQEQQLIDFRPYIGAATRRFIFSSTMPLTESLAELLGLYLAEGFTFMGKGGRGEIGKVFFSFGHHEKSLVARVRKLVDELFSLKTWVNDRGTTATVGLGSNILTRFFRDNFGSRAVSKKIPHFILHAASNTVKVFLRAYLKGDGHVNRFGLTYVTASRTVAYQLIHLLARIDIRGTVRWHAPSNNSIDGRILRGKGWYVVHVASHEAKKLGFAFEFPAAAPRRIIRDDGHFYLPVREIRMEAYEGPVYNLTTESGTFATPFIITHNCHLYAAGFDLHTEKSVEETMKRFEDTVGAETLKVVHVNDSKWGLGSGLDRHEHIGMGYIGVKGFKAFLHYPIVRNLPWMLETPIDERRDDQENLKVVRTLGK